MNSAVQQALLWVAVLLVLHAQGVHSHFTKRPGEIGAREQGHMFGYAADEAECFDVYGLDDELLAMVPQPVIAVLFLYPLTAKVKKKGGLPVELSSLKQLEALDLSYNMLSGPVSGMLAGLKMIRSLNVSSNSLNGRLAELSGFPYIAVFNISNNSFACRLNSQIWSASNGIQILDLSMNHFVGNPQGLGHISSLTQLHMDYNLLGGRLSEKLSKLTSLKHLIIFGNKLSGHKKGDGSSSSSSSIPNLPTKVWQPRVDNLEDGEELQCDPTAYNSLYAFHIGWPCLSDEGSDEEEEGGSGTPILQLHKVAHQGCVNRIRAMTQNPHICASWADTGNVQVWDFHSHLNALAESETVVGQGAPQVLNQNPLFKFGGHRDEGYAIDWNPVTPGRLVTGDCKSCIHLWEPASDATWNVDPYPFIGHAASVEDLQWSPTESDVFSSCSVDGHIAIWDTRVGKSALTYFKAHNADVNVISWNRLASCLLASGSDDGTFSIHDLRLLKGGDSVVAHFEYHKHPVTSIEWSPHESSTLAVSSVDNQLTIWDLSLEKDDEEEAEFKAKTREQVNAPEDLPPQLLFVHQGQKDLKELHWHAQIPGMIVSTAADGFNILMPSNIQNTLPQSILRMVGC